MGILGKGNGMSECFGWGWEGSGGSSDFTIEAIKSQWSKKKKKEQSEWQVNWWDLRTSGSGPDVEARRNGMVCQLIRLCPPSGEGPAPQRGRTCSSEYLNNLIVLAPVRPYKGLVYFYWLKWPLACTLWFVDIKERMSHFLNNQLSFEMAC